MSSQLGVNSEAHKEWLEAATIVQGQIRETVKQEAQGVSIRSGTVTCPCGKERAALLMYRCLYCKVYFCDRCAEDHFGKTVEEYKSEFHGEPQ